eukprot:CAMPEP_0168830148 /NCGR_PEP_ID=MMETSP0727-20121128/1381_1 /TAXON_ID=265536 /ORGANISM="Amphiprora sp., Strain CCMP467" /LENGTH=137 /DNA_ID=CAMNT_0008883369 /DNA_START=197 /DNA_END=607 /DNA_ORIENTATION=+
MALQTDNPAYTAKGQLTMVAEMSSNQGAATTSLKNSGPSQQGGDDEGFNAVKPMSNEEVLNVAFFSFVGFVVFQAVFALIAKSQSMLADSEAMTVDAVTYLFNLCAERIKNRPPKEAELRLKPKQRKYQRELRRLSL